MNNCDYPIGSDTPDAPWNQPLDIKYERFISVTISYYDEVELPPGAEEEQIKEALRQKASDGNFPKNFDIDELVILED